MIGGGCDGYLEVRAMHACDSALRRCWIREANKVARLRHKAPVTCLKYPRK